MKIVVIGGTGLIGTKVVERLRRHGHDVVAASPSSGVNTLTGEGLDAAFAGVHTVIDLANSPSFEDQAVLDFFTKAGTHIAKAEQKAGVKHHVALSIVGTDRIPDSGYMRAKVAQERIIRDSGIPYTIVHSTQFFEFLPGIVKSAAGAEGIHVTTALIQPIAAEDVADAVTDFVLAPPANGGVEIGGPDKLPMAELVRNYLEATKDTHTVLADPKAPYFGAVLEENSLVAGPDARIGKIDFKTWFATRGA